MQSKGGNELLAVSETLNMLVNIHSCMSDNQHNIVRIEPPSEKEIFGEHKFGEIELGMLQMQILWIVDRKPTHGYDMMRILNEIKKTKITQGTLYPALAILEERGYIKREEQERKVVYNITSAGKKAMNEACTDFSKTFFGIFQNFVCEKCVGHEHEHDKDVVKIGGKK